LIQEHYVASGAVYLVVLPNRRKTKFRPTDWCFRGSGAYRLQRPLVNLLGTDGGNACENPGQR
jgi:hypothetical protein